MDKEQLRLYRTPNWAKRRQYINRIDNGQCYMCGRKSPDVILQVHHLKYIPGRKPWEYDDDELVTICKGCHAIEHGKIIPTSGWTYDGCEDLGDLSGVCEYCGHEIRFEHYIHHEQYKKNLIVGCDCADKLTESNQASINDKKQKQFNTQCNRFIKSNKWKQQKDTFVYDSLDNYKIKIFSQNGFFYVKISFICWIYNKNDNANIIINRVNALHGVHIRSLLDAYGYPDEYEIEIESPKKHKSFEEIKHHIFFKIKTKMIEEWLKSKNIPIPNRAFK